jgi:uncharacterized membrane-anchored protein
MLRTVLAVLAAVLLLVPAALAQSADGDATNAAKPDLSWVDSVPRQTGVIQLPGAGAQLDLGSSYEFISAGDAKRILTEVWGNPPDNAEGVLGLIEPKGGDPRAAATWGAVVTFVDTGYVPDKDAKSTDYDKLLSQMREGEADDNADRKKRGLDTMHLVGWAQSPTYDAQKHLLIWATAFDVSTGEHTLNYDIRVLGRKGVLSVNVLAPVSSLADINAAAASIGGTVQFQPGQRYADYNSSTDKTAAFGIGGLIAAGAGAAVAQKLGLFGLILAFAKKGIVIVLAGFAATAARFRKTFARLFGGRAKPAVKAPIDPPPSSGGRAMQPAGPLSEAPRFGRRPPTGGDDIVS